MSKEIRSFDTEVRGNELLAKDTWRLTLKPCVNFSVATILPGQFMVVAPLSEKSVMIRPFSVSMVLLSQGTFSILYKLVGENTRLMSELKFGDKLKIFGPLGNGFLPSFSGYDEFWLVGGGIGIAPLFFYEMVASGYNSISTMIFYGGKSKDEFVEVNCYDSSSLVNIASDDGSIGFQGFVTDLFEIELAKVPKKKILTISCGPQVMMEKVAKICELAKIDCYVLLEQIMACGSNSCKGCSIMTKSGMKQVCHHGPVFDAKEVIWDES